MIKQLRNRLAYWLLSHDPDPVEVGRNGRTLESDSIQLNIYRGAGGLAVETLIYNRKRDENIIGFHIVHDDRDLGVSLSKIITAESIKAL